MSEQDESIRPWGNYEILLDAEYCKVKRIFVKPGQRLSLQYHEEKEETIYVLEGLLKVWETDDDNQFTLYGTGSTFHVKPNQVHRFGAGDKLVRLMEVSTPHLNDVVRLADDYNR